MIKLKNRKKNEIGIMISPMIDMSFLLLVFFIVTTMNMSEVQTVPVQLPAATQAQTQQESRFNVAVREDGSLYLGTKPITREALLAQALPGLPVLRKVRWAFPYAGRTVEIDLYPFWSEQAILEVELPSPQEVPLLPPEIAVLREVTDDPDLKNRALALEQARLQQGRG